MHDQPIDNHSSVNERLLSPFHYNAKASYTKEDYPYLHRKLARKNHSENKAETSEQEKTSNNTLEQTSSPSFSLSASFINGMESLSIISDERQSTSTAEFYFANDSLCKQRIIDQLSSEQSRLLCIHSIEDLEKHGLIQQVWLENNILCKEEGWLFLENSLTLIFDLTAMTPSDIASFNDMLQVKPRCNDKPLGDHVRRVFLVNDSMLNGEQVANPDLWRRLGQMSQKEIPDADGVLDSITDETLLTQKITEEIPASKSAKVIEFADCDEWYFLLFGGITLDENGLFIFSEGALANLDDDIHLVLKNAPWNSTGFKEEIAWVLRTGEFEANRKWIMLPDNITLSREDVSTSELGYLKSQIIKEDEVFNAQEVFVCINSASMENLKGSIRIEGTSVVKVDMLANLLNDSKQLVITSELSEKQWLWLLAKLDKLPEDERPLLFSNLPPVLLLSDRTMHRYKAGNLKSFYKDDELNNSFVYNINPKDTLESLHLVNLKSQNNFTFSLTSSSMMKNLVNGTPVILRGLECNSTLSASLETLLLPHPYLFIHGNKVDLSNAKVSLTSSAKGKVTNSSLINQVFSTTLSTKQSLSKNPVYSLLESLPRSCQKNNPNTPPWSSDTFEYHLDRQIKAEQQQDNSTELMSCHKRCAMHVLLAKQYRENSTAYSFIKAKIAQYYPDTVTDHRSDRSALQQWLAKLPIIDMESIKKDFWILARHCPVDVYESINDINDIDKVSLKKLATHLVGVAHKSWQATLAHQLKVDLQLASGQSFFDGVMRSTLRDALIANKTSLKPGTVISKTVALLEKKIVPVLAKNSNGQQKAQQINELLVFYFQDDRLPEGYQDLPDALITNQRHTHARQQRRLARLADLIQLHPIVFLQGEAGVGKTFMAKAVANKAGYSGCKVIQLDPNQTSDKLFGGQQLKRYIVDNKTDHYCEFYQGPLLEWASSDNPELLILDEANLASEGLLSPLLGLTRARPELHYQGNKYPLMKTHRIIMTGNPEHYGGRYLDKALQSRIPIVFYPPIQDSVLADSIILPDLPKWPSGQKQQACDRIITLLNFFKELVPGDLVTPRDIKDVLATVHQILSHYPEPLENPTEEQINALIRRAFMDSLAGAVTEDYQQRLNSLNWWYQGQYPEDQSVMTNMDQVFDGFVKQLQAENPDAYFSPAPIRQLVYRYWQNLDKGEGGRVAVLVEGATGWGKDFVLGKTIKLWQKQHALESLPGNSFVHINANPSQWGVMEESLKQAKVEGWVLGVSECNVVPGHYMDGLLNDVLTGHAKQGFRLFATINPSSFEGREVLSPALKNRCTQVKLGALSQSQMEELVQGLSDMSQGLPQWLAENFHQLSTELNNQKSPVRLTLDDLLSSAKDLANKDADQWQDAFQQHLPLQFRALSRDIFLPISMKEREHFALEHTKEQHRLKCDKEINSLPGLSAPLTVRFGNLPSIGAQEITVNLNTTVEQVARNVKLALQNRKVSDDKTVKSTSAATCVEKPSKGSLYALRAINKKSKFEVTCYFPKGPYRYYDYRLNLQTTCLDENGKFRIYPIDWENGGSFADVAGWPDYLYWRTDLRGDEVPGHIVLTLNDQWQSLPSLTPADQLRAIRCAPNIEIQLTRCQTTGLLLIKYQGSRHKKVTIDFIIAPEQCYFTQLKRGDSLIIQKNLGSQRFKVLMDENIFHPKWDTCDAYQELRIINQVDDIPQRLNVLMNWLDTFTSDKNITGKSEKILLNMLKEKQGSCVYKSIVFDNLCRYWGIPARQVKNVCHSFAEVSPDGGDTWRQYMLGGGGRSIIYIADENWNEYSLPARSELSQPVHRASLANSRCNQVVVKVSPSTSSMPRKGVFSSCKRDMKKINPGLFQNFPNKKNRESENEDEYIKKLVDNLIYKIEKTFRQDQHLSNVHLMKLKDHLRQNLDNIETNKTKLIKQLVVSIRSCFIKYTRNDYLNCLCHLCEINNDMLGYLYIGMLSNPLFSDRVQKAIKNLTSFVNEMVVVDAKKDTSEMACFVRSLPNSKYLERKITQVIIDKTYTMAPKENSHLSFERMATGLPFFVNQSTLKDSKPVIIDVYDISEGITNRIWENISCPLNKKNSVWRWILQNNRGSFIDTCERIALEAFFYWIAKHKPKDNSVWRWLFCGYTICYEQTSPIQTPIINHSKYSYFVERTSEAIKTQLKEPNAVVLKKADFLFMLDEFLKEI